MEKRRRPHQNRPCPFPISTLEQASAYKIPTSVAEWAALENVKKLDANDLVHDLGPKGFLKRLDEMETHVICWNESRIVSLGTLQRAYPKMRDPVIHGLLRHSETMNIIAAPKSSKSWLGLNIAMNVIGGGKLFDQFQCERGRVLIVDNELHEETIAERGRFVASALNVPRSRAARLIDFLPLRGNITSIEQLGEELKYVRARHYNVIILDAFYKFYPEGFDENDNAAMARLYTILDDLAERTDAALILIHHASKGNSSGKSVTDMGAGAGSQSRACDAHLVLREHREENVFVIEMANRSFKKVPAFCARFDWPLWSNAPSYDPSELKGLPVKKDGFGKQTVGKAVPMTREERVADDRRRVDAFVAETITKPMSQADILQHGTGKGFNPWSRDRVRKLVEDLIHEKKIRVAVEGAGRVATTYISTTHIVQEVVALPEPQPSSPEHDGYTAGFNSDEEIQQNGLNSEDYGQITDD